MKTLFLLLCIFGLFFQQNLLVYSCNINQNIKSDHNIFKQQKITAINTGTLLLSLSLLPTHVLAKVLDKNECDNNIYKKSIFNIPPKPFTFPSYFEGNWRSSFSFVDAKFTNQFSMKELSDDVNIAGFRK